MNNYYFITGATGVIGSAIVPILLENNANHVHLLVRARDVETMNLRIEDLYHFWSLEEGNSRRNQISTSLGDATKPLFGLEKQKYNQLREKCTNIIHCAGAVRMNLLLEDARKSAVGSAENIVKLGEECENLKKVDFVSTVGVAGRLREPLAEEWIRTRRKFHNTYEQAKSEAEIVVRQALEEKSLPITVHRPSMVIGDSRTGKIIHFQIFYHICEFLSGIRTWGVFPPLKNATIDLIPVDFVANAIAWSSVNTSTIGKIFHLCAGPDGQMQLLALQDIILREFKNNRIPVRRPLYFPIVFFRLLAPLLKLVVSGKYRKAISTLPIFLDYLTSRSTFLNNYTIRILEHEANLNLLPSVAVVPVVIQEYLDKR